MGGGHDSGPDPALLKRGVRQGLNGGREIHWGDAAAGCGGLKSIIWVREGCGGGLAQGNFSGLSRTRGGFFDFEVGGHDGAYKGRVHMIVPFVGRKNGNL